MLIKKADDKGKRLSLLEDLQRSAVLDARQKQWLREELSRLRKGIQGERDSAYYLDQYFKDSENHVVLHDLRFVIDGDVAQIDHLVISRSSAST
ncbi:nuclease-related domain-containing protein [Ramlibacter sp. MMS24-I3-19]|uniref:nuclease-related domain-containing protein n=1 Tax=Ramlibacter sp. MMS24-I3-19 TaxID=3416606 RepID=UPI003D082E0A